MSKRFVTSGNGTGVLIKAFFWGLGILILFLIFLSLVQCSIRKPSSPTWNTKLIIPLINKTYDMPEIVKEIDDSSLVLDSLGSPCFSQEIEIDTFKMEKLLTIPENRMNFKETLGVLQVSSPDTQVNEFYLTEVYPGTPGLVPPFSFLLQENLQQIKTFTSVKVEQGIAHITVSNHLGVDIDSLTIDLVDDLSSHILGTLVFTSGVKNDSSKIQSIDLKGQSFSNDLSYNIQAHTPGGTILSLADKYINLTLSFPDSLSITAAQAQIPEISLNKQKLFDISTSHRIQSGEIKNGNIALTISNQTNLPADLTITLPDFTRAQSTLTINRFLNAKENINLNLSLDDYTFRPQETQEIRVNLSVRIPGSGQNQVWISSADSILVEANIGQLEFSQLSAVIAPTQIDLGLAHKDLDFPTGFENAQLLNAYLSCEIENGANLPANLFLTINGSQGKRLNLSGQIAPGSSEDPVITMLSQNDLQDFFNPIPYGVTVTGQAFYGDGVKSTTITQRDFACGKIKILSPIEVIFDSNRVKLDQSSDSLKEDQREEFHNRVNWTKAIIKLENHLPADASFELLVKSSPNVYDYPDLVIGPVNITCGPKDANGVVISSANSENTITLTKVQLQIFEGNPFYLGGYIYLSGTDGQKVKFVASDYIKVSAFLETEIKSGEIK
jgi:hypothetical protein